MLAFLLALCASGCKSKKKAMEAQAAAAERARIEQEASARKAEEDRKKEAEEAARKEAEARNNRELKATEPKARLNNYFAAISNSASPAAANSSINEALMLFVSPETPVLIVISEEGGQKDYDRPTTIRDYLNYLKDQKKNLNEIADLKFDAAGKISEVELRKN
jgi:hypothetical protein